MRDKQLVKELKEKYKEEKIFVLPINAIENIEDKFVKMRPDKDIWSKYDNTGKYIYRYDAEYNPVFQQLIPYLLVTNKDESKYFIARRIKGDHRLVDNLSLGFGGHIDECDGTREVVLKALSREMNEELDIDPITKAVFMGTIRDITSKTNDHFGLVFRVKAEEGDVFIRETENMEGVWMTKEDMFINYPKFEGWSKYIIDYLYENK